MAAVAYKPIYDAKEASLGTPEWQTCYLEMIRLAPGLALAFMEALIFTALSVAISTRLPLLANMTICLVIYALGHLTPLVVESSVEARRLRDHKILRPIDSNCLSKLRAI